MRPNPFDEIETLLERMERGFDAGLAPGSGSVPVDVLDRPEEYVVLADVPGYGADELDVTFSEGRLRIVAEGDNGEADPEDERYLRRERRSGADRAVAIPGDVEEDGITATCDDGVLTVTLPKRIEQSGTRIDVE